MNYAIFPEILIFPKDFLDKYCENYMSAESSGDKKTDGDVESLIIS